jgi:hypothetical protein
LDEVVSVRPWLDDHFDFSEAVSRLMAELSCEGSGGVENVEALVSFSDH